MPKTVVSVVWICLTLATTGCLTKETTETMYLETDGTVTWTFLERGVRSDSKVAEERVREETAYLATASEGRHPLALALASLNPISVRFVILRGTAPYSVFGDARFARLDTLMTRVIEQIGVRGTSTLERRNGTLTWTLAMDPDERAGRSKRNKDGVDDLLASFTDCRFLLAGGHFLDAVGFELSEDRLAATVHLPDTPDIASSAEPLRLSLTWTERGK